MTLRRAAVRLALDGGADLTDQVKPRLLELQLSERREDDADTLDFTLDNSDGRLAVPGEGARLALSLGWEAGADVPLGLVDKGKFTVDEVELSGPPDRVRISARSADLTGLLRKRATKSWNDKTLGAILNEIAARHERTARIGGDLAGLSIETIEQDGKSDMAFVRDLGKRYDAVATWKDDFLLFLPIGAGQNASGSALASATFVKRDGWTWSFRRGARENYSGAEAQWHDQAEGRRRTVKVSGQGDGEPRKLKRVYANETEARQAAEAAATRDSRRPLFFTYSLAIADPGLQLDMPIFLNGWNDEIDGVEWLLKSADTSFSANAGLRQNIELESRNAAS